MGHLVYRLGKVTGYAKECHDDTDIKGNQHRAIFKQGFEPDVGCARKAQDTADDGNQNVGNVTDVAKDRT